jgi:hypothetical protein
MLLLFACGVAVGYLLGNHNSAPTTDDPFGITEIAVEHPQQQGVVRLRVIQSHDGKQFHKRDADAGADAWRFVFKGKGKGRDAHVLASPVR